MKILLDTNVALWAIIDDPRLGPRATALISDPGNAVCVSAVNLWEIAIKHALRREKMPVSGTEARRYFDQSGYLILSLGPDHVLGVERLPRIHSDPFDRLLVAQAIEEGCRLLTRDSVLPRYSDLVLAV